MRRKGPVYLDKKVVSVDGFQIPTGWDAYRCERDLAIWKSKTGLTFIHVQDPRADYCDCQSNYMRKIE